MTKQAGSLFSVDVLGLDAGRRQPACVRICDRIRVAITSGALAPRARLPSGRTLARDLCVARSTADAALDQLVADGYVVRRRGAGSFVVDQLPQRDAPPLGARRAPGPVADTKATPRLSQRGQALRAYAGAYKPERAVAFTPSLPPLDLFQRQVWN
jgi:GntR family transcriptional regulator / MocR family aminotransferase